MKNEVVIRLSCFFGIFALIAVWELIMPRRILTTSRGKRWLANLGIVFLNSALVRVAVPVLPVGLAMLAQKEGWGLQIQGVKGEAE